MTDHTEVEGQQKQKVYGHITNFSGSQRREFDYYPTPNIATDILLRHEKFDGEIWECAVGDGIMKRRLESNGYTVTGSDIQDAPWVDGRGGVDFLLENKKAANIITNPPYKFVHEFIKHGYQLAEKKLAYLLRLSHLEGVKRCNTIYKAFPPARIIIISKRIPMWYQGQWKTNGNTYSHCWQIWDKENTSGKTELIWDY
jgi:hypothetical protein